MKGLILAKNSSGLRCDDCIFKEKYRVCVRPGVVEALIGDCLAGYVYQVDYVKQVDIEEMEKEE